MAVFLSTQHRLPSDATRRHTVDTIEMGASSPQGATVADVVHKLRTKFDGRPVRDFVPLLVERNAQAELAKLGG
jgi:hypothetical protein